MERDLIVYLDTHVAIWLGAGMIKRVNRQALKTIDKSEPLLSSMALLELEFMHEVGRSKLRAQDIVRKLEHEIGLRICELSFSTVATVALDENWTRDPFDRLIVANAKANGFAPLISADREIAKHYPRTVW